MPLFRDVVVSVPLSKNLDHLVAKSPLPDMDNLLGLRRESGVAVDRNYYRYFFD